MGERTGERLAEGERRLDSELSPIVRINAASSCQGRGCRKETGTATTIETETNRQAGRQTQETERDRDRRQRDRHRHQRVSWRGARLREKLRGQREMERENKVSHGWSNTVGAKVDRKTNRSNRAAKHTRCWEARWDEGGREGVSVSEHKAPATGSWVSWNDPRLGQRLLSLALHVSKQKTPPVLCTQREQLRRFGKKEVKEGTHIRGETETSLGESHTWNRCAFVSQRAGT